MRATVLVSGGSLETCKHGDVSPLPSLLHPQQRLHHRIHNQAAIRVRLTGSSITTSNLLFLPKTLSSNLPSFSLSTKPSTVVGFDTGTEEFSSSGSRMWGGCSTWMIGSSPARQPIATLWRTCSRRWAKRAVDPVTRCVVSSSVRAVLGIVCEGIGSGGGRWIERSARGRGRSEGSSCCFMTCCSGQMYQDFQLTRERCEIVGEVRSQSAAFK